MLASEVQTRVREIVDLLLLIMQNINRCPFAAISNIFAWECISMGVQVIPIPTDLVLSLIHI